jgi:hypothetical protein
LPRPSNGLSAILSADCYRMRSQNCVVGDGRALPLALRRPCHSSICAWAYAAGSAMRRFDQPSCSSTGGLINASNTARPSGVSLKRGASIAMPRTTLPRRLVILYPRDRRPSRNSTFCSKQYPPRGSLHFRTAALVRAPGQAGCGRFLGDDQHQCFLAQHPPGNALGDVGGGRRIDPTAAGVDSAAQARRRASGRAPRSTRCREAVERVSWALGPPTWAGGSRRAPAGSRAWSAKFFSTCDLGHR